MKFRFPWRTRAMLSSEIDEEIGYHLARREAELQREGLEAGEARRRAALEFGDLAGARTYCLEQDHAAERQLRWTDRLGDFQRSLRLAARRLNRQPMLLLTAAGTLGLGIGAATALWTVVRQVAIKPFPFRDADRLVVLWHEVPESQVRITPQFAAVEFWRGQATTLDAVEPILPSTATLQAGGGAAVVHTKEVAETFFDFTGLRPSLGRAFAPADREPGAPKVTLLGRSYWRTAFGEDPGVIGKTVLLDNERVEIIGVLPRGLDYLPGSWRGGVTQFLLPLPARPGADKNSYLIGRIRKGVTIEAARTELRTLDARLTAEHESLRQYQTRIDAGRDQVGARNIRTLYILLGSVGVLLLIACANVAHLLLGRMLARRNERAVRAALGATRADLLQTGLLDAGIIGFLGAGLGLALSIPLVGLIVANRPPALEMLEVVHPDLSAGLVAGLLGIVVTLLAGVVPAWRGARAAPAELLHGSWAAGQPEGRRLREVLLVTEVGLSLLLLVGAGLVTRSLWRLGQLDVGFEPSGLVSATLELPAWRYQTPAAREAFLREVTDGVRSLPGVEAATRASGVPPQVGVSFGELGISGRELSASERESFFAFQSVESDYFVTMGLPLLAGSSFESRASSRGEATVIVSNGLARRYWPAGDAVGHQVRLTPGSPWQRIVGVAADVPGLGLGELRGAMHIYAPISGEGDEANIIARTAMPPAAFETALLQVVNRFDSNVPIRRITTVPALLRESTATERFTGALLAGFAAFATVLFAAGLFGVLSHAVSQRTREIGVRIAIGADPRQVRRLVVWQGMRPVLIGLVLGLFAAWMGGKTLAALLFDITPRDLLTFAAAATVTIVVALAASYLPARRASRLDPVSSLRAE